MNVKPQSDRRVAVAILLPARCWAGSVHLVRELLQVVGTLRARSQDVAASEAFEIQLVGSSKRPVHSFGGVSLLADVTIRAQKTYDVVIVPAQFMPSGPATPEDLAFIPWIVQQHAQGAMLVSLGGAVLLAKTGLLDGQEATGLVSDRALFLRHFTRVRYNPSRRIVAGGRIVTVCGIGPTVDACAYLVERYFGVALARRFLRQTSVEITPARERLTLWSAGYKHHRDAQVLAAQDMVERELHQLPSMAHMAAQVGVSSRALSRRWVAATGLNVRQYVAALRLELGEALLRTTDMPLVTIASECGFSSASAMSRAFAERFGKGPGRYRIDLRAAP